MSLNFDESFECPYCGEINHIQIDVGGGPHQRLITDCEVCCSPIVVSVRITAGEIVSVDVRKENG